MGRRLFAAVLVLFVFCGAVSGAVSISVIDIGDGWAAIDYVSDANVSGLALDITVTHGVIEDVNILYVGLNDDVNGLGFGIFPASFARVIDPNLPDWNVAGYSPVADSGDAGALGGLGTSGITIEMGALGEAAPTSGTLIHIQVSEGCNVCVWPNATRGNIVLEGGADGGFAGPSCAEVSPPFDCWCGPLCWDYDTQCNGDTDDNGTVDTADWPNFRDGFGKVYPDQAYMYNACADFNRDGSIDTVDWPKFRDNFGGTPAGGCPPGDLNEIFKP
jgi:hypothetical protein